MPRSKLVLKNCQIKSAEKLRQVCKVIDLLEKETFMASGCIRFVNVFVCPDIDLLEFANSADPTERLIGGICIRLHNKKYGRASRYSYIKA